MSKWRGESAGAEAEGLREFRAHWPALFAATVGVAFSVSALPFYTAGIFVAPLQAAFHWSRGEIASANTALFWAIGLASPFAGALLDRFGVKRVVLGSMLALMASFIGLSLLNGSLGLYLTIASLMGFLGAGASAIAFTRTINQRFKRSRGLALGICLMGSGLTGLLAPGILEGVITSFGWRWAYRAIAAAIALVLPLMLLLGADDQSQPSAPSAASPRFQFLGDRRFGLLTAAVVLMSFATMGATYHLAPLLGALTGSAETGARQAGLVGLSVILSRIVGGWALDRTYAPMVAAVVALMGAAGSFALGQGMVGWSVAAVLLLGAALGAEFDLMAYLTSRYFPPQAYGRVYGPIFGVSVLVSGVSPLILGALYDWAGDYRLGYGLTTAAFLIAIPCFLALGPYEGAKQRSPAAGLPRSAS
jgi:MFS family permease